MRGRSDLIFQLKMIPFATPAAVQRMFDSGIINRKTHVGTMLSLNGLRPEDEALEEEEIKRPPLGGNENQTTAHMRSKVDVQQAEAEERRMHAKHMQAEIEGKLNDKKEEKEDKKEEKKEKKEKKRKSGDEDEGEKKKKKKKDK